MKTENITIFKNDIIEVIFNSTDSKGILVHVTAINPVDGKSYSRVAGWISRNWYLHSFGKTPAYIFEAAAIEFHKNIFKIAEHVLRLYKKMHSDFIEQWQKSKNSPECTVEVNGRQEPKYGMADTYRYYYKMMGENLELIKNERKKSEFKKLPKGDFNNNKIRVSR